MRGQVLVLATVLFLCASIGAQTPSLSEARMAGGASEATSDSMEALWVLRAGAEPARHVELHVHAEDTAAGSTMSFACQLTSQRVFENVLVRLAVTEEDGTLVSTGELKQDLRKGSNSCRFQWDSGALPPGIYQAAFAADYTAEYPAARAWVTIQKVTSTQLKADLDTATGDLTEVGRHLDKLSEGGTKYPYLHVRLRIAEEAAMRAAQDAEAGAWRRLGARLAYVQRTVEGIRAGLVFGGMAPELVAPLPEVDLSHLEVRDGAFYAQGRPVFLLGRVLAEHCADDIARLRHYGLNLAAFSMGPSETLADPEQAAAFEAHFDPLFQQAAESNVSLTVQLAPDDLGAWLFDACPDLRDKGFVDLAHPGAQAAFERHLRAVVPYLAGQAMVNSLSMANQPQFKFDSEAIRQAFLEHVRGIYADRQDLNQAWRAHLATFDSITIWDEEAAPHEYQNRPPYQYDWQTFHRHLATQYFHWARSLVRSLAPGLPVEVTLTDQAFEPGETRMGVDREAVAQLMDISGCSATTDPNDSYYALSYPRQSAFYTLMRSLEPKKPVFNLEDHVVLDGKMDPPYSAAYVRSALWEGVICGLNGTALAANTTLFDQPESLEAFATACLDINRLAPIVNAFQQTPPDVAVLYSDVSKIFNDGLQHLKSAWFAFEGCSFGGYNVRFITEKQVAASGLDTIKVLVIPQTPAVSDEAFDVIMAYVENGGTVARVGTPIPYNEYGQSRHDVIRNTGKTVLVRGMNLPTEYLHAMDAAIVLGALPKIPRPINAHGYPLEGVKTRYIQFEDQEYLYAINLRKDTIPCHLAGGARSGRDLIKGRDIDFPTELPPLEPMLVRLDKIVRDVTVAASNTGA